MRAPRIEKTVGTRFALNRPNLAKARPPGRRETAAWERTTAAKARVVEPSRWKAPAWHIRTGGGAGGWTCFVPPQPAATTSRSKETVKLR